MNENCLNNNITSWHGDSDARQITLFDQQVALLPDSLIEDERAFSEFIRHKIASFAQADSKCAANQSAALTPAFFQVDLGEMIGAFDLWAREMPRVHPFYAVKCQTDPLLLAMLCQMGAGFDCASRAEIQLVLDQFTRMLQLLRHTTNETMMNETTTPPMTSLPPPATDALRNLVGERIIYANPFKMRRDIAFARRAGVRMTTFDSHSELEKLARLWPEAELLLRIAPARRFRARCQLADKFGVVATTATCRATPNHPSPSFSGELDRLIDGALELGMRLIGVSFHVGSGCEEETAWSDTLELALAVLHRARERGHSGAHIVDLGGGWRAQDKQQQQEFASMAAKLRNTINDAQHQKHPAEIRFIAEPGRFFAANAFTLMTQVIGERTLSDVISDKADKADKDDEKNGEKSDETEMRHLILADGLYGSFNNIVFDHEEPRPIAAFCWHNPMRAEEGKEEERAEARQLCLTLLDNDNSKDSGEKPEKQLDNRRVQYKMFGPTCDNFDCVLPCYWLPDGARVATGDWLMWRRMGAYTSVAASGFNGIGRPDKFYHVSQSDLELILRHIRAHLQAFWAASNFSGQSEQSHHYTTSSSSSSSALLFPIAMRMIGWEQSNHCDLSSTSPVTDLIRS